jgi:hypothetical protein
MGIILDQDQQPKYFDAREYYEKLKDHNPLKPFEIDEDSDMSDFIDYTFEEFVLKYEYLSDFDKAAVTINKYGAEHGLIKTVISELDPLMAKLQSIQATSEIEDGTEYVQLAHTADKILYAAKKTLEDKFERKVDW